VAALNKTIQEFYPDMSSGQKKIAEYILKNYDKAVFLTAKELGHAVGVSESTVIRFANLLRYNGYPQLQKAMQDMLKNRITTVERMQLSLLDKEGDILQQVLKTDIDNIRLTMEQVSHADFGAAVEAIVKARHIYIISLRSTAALGYFFYFYLQLLLKNCRLINDTNIFFEELRAAESEDLVIGISFPRYTRRTVEGLQYCQEKGARVLAITDSLASPLAKYSDQVLTVHSGHLSFIDTLTAPFSLINALILGVGSREGIRTALTLSQLEETWKQFNIYHAD
jgi:DNA-binding MurR/RpiR family transcriptional regulator